MRAYRTLNKAEDYPLIAGLLRAGLCCKDIADKFDICSNTVRRFATGKSSTFTVMTEWSSSDVERYRSQKYTQRKANRLNQDRRHVMLNIASMLRAGRSPLDIASATSVNHGLVGKWAAGHVRTFTVATNWTKLDIANYKKRRWR